MPRDLVTIGGSWGGIEAVGRILSDLPSGFPAAVAIALHRGADSKDAPLVRALTACTGLPVRGVEDKQPIDAGTVYLAPPGYHLIVEPGQFALSTEAPVHFSRPSIDVLLDSAAEAYGSRLVGVVLTGANPDGAAGLRSVEQRGGFPLIQDPATAERPEMPLAAIAATRRHRIARLESMAPILVELCGDGGAAASPDGRRLVA